MDGAVEGAVADVVVALLSSSKMASWRLLILSPLALPRLALPRADRGVSLHQQSVWPTLALWFKPNPDGLRLGSRERGKLRRAFDDLRRLPGPPRQIALNRRDRVHNLVFRHRFDAALRLDLHFLWHNQNQKLKENSGLVLHHLLDRLATTEIEGPMHFQDRGLVQRLTRSLRTAARVSLISFRRRQLEVMPGSVSSSCENRTCRISLVVTLPLPFFSTRTSCCASGRPAGMTIFPPAFN